MFTKRSESAEHLDRAIIELQEELIKNDLPDKDWNQKFDRLHQLTLLREKPNSVSPDTVAIIGANLIGLIMILSL